MKKLRRKIRDFVLTIIERFAPTFAMVKKTDLSIMNEMINRGLLHYVTYDIENYKKQVLQYVESMHNVGFQYRFAQSCEQSSIYSSVYACLIFSLFGNLQTIDEDVKRQWARYFDSFQDKDSGLFFDQNIYNSMYESIDWWGARHLCPHIINAYIALGYRPQYEFNYLKLYYDTEYLQKWLDETNWNSAIPNENDVDNKIMNIGVMLQYQRDFCGDKAAAKAISFIKTYLKGKVNSATGLWGNYDTTNRIELCRMVQFSYHLLRIFMYDNEEFENMEKIIDNILMSQNDYGGFGAKIPSSACEDIDAIDPLVYFSTKTPYRSEDIKIALRRALVYVLVNQNDDGGFVFRRGELLYYGHENMSSQADHSAMFPTWFRTLSIAYISKVLPIGDFHFVKSPGY